MKVFAYFEQIGFPIEGAVIEQWKETWARYGWDPVLLSHDDAAKWLGFEAFQKAVSEFPTVNPKAYELACFKRWAAMAALGGGLMADYDVMNFGFRPTDYEAMSCPLHLTFFESNGVPSCVGGPGELFALMCQHFAAYKPSGLDTVGRRAHISDQDICCRRFAWLPLRTRRLVRQYRDDGWEEAPMVHFTNASTGGHHKKLEALAAYRREELAIPA